jgi:hypothetical protein
VEQPHPQLHCPLLPPSHSHSAALLLLLLLLLPPPLPPLLQFMWLTATTTA